MLEYASTVRKQERGGRQYKGENKNTLPFNIMPLSSPIVKRVALILPPRRKKTKRNENNNSCVCLVGAVRL